MQIDKKIETPVGSVHFKGEVSDEEFDYIIEAGLMYLMATGRLQTTVTIEGPDDLPELDDAAPSSTDPIH